jgi:DNA-binding IclR family transcriptional regulator
VWPVLSSTTRRLFGAYQQRRINAGFVEREPAGTPHPGATPTGKSKAMTKADVEALFEDVRKHRMARVLGDLNPGLHGLSAPIFDHADSVAGVITIMGSAGLIDTSLDGRNAAALAEAAREVSRRMGWNS